MQIKADGQTYAPRGMVSPVCEPGTFKIGVIGLDHGHIYGMCNGLVEAGAEIACVYDNERMKMDAFCKVFPDAKKAESEHEILENPDIALVASAILSDRRTELGIRVMKAGKDYFCDKPPCITKQDVSQARRAVEETQKKFAVYYSERLHVEASVCAEKLIKDGAIGRVIHVAGWGPHRISIPQRPSWFFDKARYGGILVDIGCHQIEQLLFFCGASDAVISSSRAGNYKYKQYPRFEDFGDAALLMNNGTTGYFSVNWFTPDGLGAWGDGRTFIQGTEGYIELRKYIDVAADPEGDHVILVNNKGEQHIHAAGTCGFPFFGRLIKDCLERTSTAYDQELTFRAIELAIEAETQATAVQ